MSDLSCLLREPLINKHRFGTTKISYDVYHAFMKILDAINEIEPVGETLWNLSKDELIILWNNSYGDDEGEGALLCNNHTLYPGAYTFDGCLALFLKMEENVRLILKDDGVCEEVRMESNLFFGHLKEIYTKLGLVKR